MCSALLHMAGNPTPHLQQGGPGKMQKTCKRGDPDNIGSWGFFLCFAGGGRSVWTIFMGAVPLCLPCYKNKWIENINKHASWECKYKFDGRKWNSNQKWNNDKCWCECKKHIFEKDYIWNPAISSCKNGTQQV